MSQPRSWVFFDLGWTLVDETDVHLARFARLQPHLAEDSAVTADRFMLLCEQAATRFARSPFREVIESLGLTFEDATRIGASYDHSGERLYEGVHEVLAQLRPSHNLGLIANQSAGTVDRLKKLGIHDAFSIIVSSAEAGLSKPDPRIFAHALSLAGCGPENASMVGDRLDNDIAPARASGWRTIRVLQGFSRKQVPRSESEAPDQTINSISEFSAALI